MDILQKSQEQVAHRALFNYEIISPFEASRYYYACTLHNTKNGTKHQLSLFNSKIKNHTCSIVTPLTTIIKNSFSSSTPIYSHIFLQQYLGLPTTIFLILSSAFSQQRAGNSPSYIDTQEKKDGFV